MPTGPKGEKRPTDVNARAARNHLRLYASWRSKATTKLEKVAATLSREATGKRCSQLRRRINASVEIWRETDGPLTRGSEVGQPPPSCQVFVQRS
jgi:hypothetical protein